MKRRDSNMELMRIFAMLMIVFVHVLGLTGLLTTVQPCSKKYWVLWWLEGLGCVSTNLFVLLGGYYLCTSTMTVKKVLKLVSQVWFYSVLFYLLMLCLGEAEFTWDEIRPVIFPVINTQYWFITSYLGLMLLTPLLNRAIQAMSRRTHFSIVLITVVLFSVIPSIFRRTNFLSVGEGYCLDWFICLYLIGSYLRKYPIPFGTAFSGLLTWLLGSAVYPLSRAVVLWLIEGNAAKPVDLTWLNMRNSIFALTASLGLFHFFLRLRIPNDSRAARVICRISPLVFGVYLFHMNPSLYGSLWGKLIHPVRYVDSLLLWPYLLLATLALFLCGILIEWLRSQIFRGSGKAAQAAERFFRADCLYRILGPKDGNEP